MPFTGPGMAGLTGFVGSAGFAKVQMKSSVGIVLS